jgi:NitT/TauT family transport system ATP-binding protein
MMSAVQNSSAPRGSSDPILVVEDLRKSYFDEYSEQTINAIDGVTFDVEEGDFVSILGPSGCGKTTVLNIIAGFLPLTSGSIRLNGRPINGPGPDRGVVFQSFALFPWKTVLGNVTFGPRMRGIPRDVREKSGREYLDLVGLSGFEDKYPHELSGGMRQRVGVARALANEPQIMLMDEPFASIDAQTRMGLQEDLTAIWERRRPTIFFVTHDVEEAVFLSNKIIVLSHRPSKVREIVTVDIPRPRKWEELIENTEFRAITHHVLGLLTDKSRSSRHASAA